MKKVHLTFMGGRLCHTLPNPSPCLSALGLALIPRFPNSGVCEQNYRYTADKSTIFGRRGLWGLAINSGRRAYMNGFRDLEYPNFDPKHGSLSSIEAEIISFCQIMQPFSFSAFYVHPFFF